MKNNGKDILVSAAALTIIGGVVTAALAGTNLLTKDTIAQRTAEIENAARRQVIQADSFEKGTLTADGKEVVYYTALQNGETVGYVFTASVTGKSAGLVVMTGITAEGTISGVKVTEENETAGYVDKVTRAACWLLSPARTLPPLPWARMWTACPRPPRPARGSPTGSTRRSPITRTSRREAALDEQVRTGVFQGPIKENPVLRLVLGTCPTLAVTTAAINGLGMGAAATFVLVCSNIVISLLQPGDPGQGAAARLHRDYRGLHHHRADGWSRPICPISTRRWASICR